MGATSFETEVYTDGSAEDAYQQAVQEAFYEFGHEPYSGTIATTSGVYAVPGHKPMTLAEAEKIARDRLWVTTHKWGDCEALPLVEEWDEEWEVTGRKPVTISATPEQLRDPAWVRARIVDALQVRESEIYKWVIVATEATNVHLTAVLGRKTTDAYVGTDQVGWYLYGVAAT